MAHSDMVHTHVSGMAHGGMPGKSKEFFMIIIRMTGGLGNQMFQYALYMKLKDLGHDVKFDDVTEYVNRDNARPIQLSAFGIRYPQATHQELNDITDGSMRLSARIRRKITGRRTAEYDETAYKYDPEVLVKDPAYLVGFFQCERYFEDIADKVRNEFAFDESIFTDDMRKWEKQITKTDSVAIHLRGGDYLSTPEVYGDICTDMYYDSAIKYMSEKHHDLVYYLFSNDRSLSESFISDHKGFDIREVTCSEEYTGYLDMYLMTKCRHHIIANSSFSWWGSWLSDYKDKDIIAPKVWLKNGNSADIHTKNMILIDHEGELQDE